MSDLPYFSPPTRQWFDAHFPGPTPVQAGAWPHIAAGDHTLLLAPTGSGKTLAAFLACLDRTANLPAEAPAGVRVLYISPLKALAHDIERNLRAPLVGIQLAAQQLGQAVRPLSVDVRTGDTSSRDRARQRRKPRDVLVTTPESLYLLLTSQARDTLRTVQTVILDEIHVLAGTKRGVHLALSLERLSALCEHEPQRVGLSATQNPPEEAARFLGGDRPVQIVDTTQPPRLELEIVVPVADMDNPTPVPADPDAPSDPDGGDPAHHRYVLGMPSQAGGIWPTLYPRLLALIRSHTSTLVFTNSRILCERVVAALNDLAGEEIVLAHHGSLSHEQRASIEDRLKAGTIPGLVATSSLELGIDMGAIDLVLLVESPASAASGLQRIGRAGHGVGLTSKGRIFPKYRGDLLQAAVVAEHMAAGQIEVTRVPRNCLDVLAQQITAMVALDPWTVEAVLQTVRRAYPYAELSPEVLHSVLDMLAGRYPDDAFAHLTPALTWDRSAGLLEGRRGAQKLAVLNGGTIPDRGLYRVVLADGGKRLGELDEEMVYESRVGDVIVLGASSWRIQDITRDQVVVVPAPGQPGRLPFWRGDRPGRPLELGRSMGAFLRQVSELPPAQVEDHLVAHTPLDPLAAKNLAAYLAEQQEATGSLPTDQAITVERFQDELGDWRICILTPFGSRLHAPWALALEAALGQRTSVEVSAFHSDDGIALRFVDLDEMPLLDALMLDPDEVEDLIVDQLRHSALFAARFREAAGRALLLPKRTPRGRRPLWLQRKKASELQLAAQRFSRFPVVLEAYRECLQDVFDVPALQDLLRQIARREVRLVEVSTTHPSPFARSLAFQFVAAYLYDGDQPLAERKAAALSLDRGLLRELLGQDQLRDLLDAGAVDEVELALQHLTPERAVRHADALHDLLRRLGSLSRDEIAARSEGDPAPWIDALLGARRIVEVQIAGEARLVAIEDAARVRDALGVVLPGGLAETWLTPAPDALVGLVRRYARTHGPFRTEAVAARFGLLPGQVEPALAVLEAEGALVHGEIRPGGQGREWCDQGVLGRLRRRSLAKLRQAVEPVEPAVYARFLPAWQGLDHPRPGLDGLREAIEQLEGLPLPFSALEAHLLPARVQGYRPDLLDTLGALGEVVWVGQGALGTRDGKVRLAFRSQAPLVLDPPAPLDEALPQATSVHHAVVELLTARGACFLTELVAGVDAPAKVLHEALWDLVWAGWVTNDTFSPLRSLLGPKPKAAGRRRGRSLRSRGVHQLGGGRWSAVPTVLGAAPVAPTERLLAQAEALLDRWGILSSEAVRTEGRPGGFTALYPLLRELEDAGHARRGYFVEGLGGAQFAQPGAVDRLRAHRDAADALGAEAPAARLLSAVDPALAWGAVLPWPDPTTPGTRPKRQTGARVVLVSGQPVLWLNKAGTSLITFRGGLATEGALEAAVAVLSKAQGYRSLCLDQIDGTPAAEATTVPRLVAAGFAVEGATVCLRRTS